MYESFFEECPLMAAIAGPNGRIERHPRTGEPTGTLRESAAALVSKHLPELDPEDYAQGLKRALRMANGFGITSLIEASAAMLKAANVSGASGASM